MIFSIYVSVNSNRVISDWGKKIQGPTTIHTSIEKVGLFTRFQKIINPSFEKVVHAYILIMKSNQYKFQSTL